MEGLCSSLTGRRHHFAQLHNLSSQCGLKLSADELRQMSGLNLKTCPPPLPPRRSTDPSLFIFFHPRFLGRRRSLRSQAA